MEQKIRLAEAKYKKEAILPFEIGDTIKVWVKIIEGDRERLQAFEGVVISIRGKGISKSFIVRKISYGVGVERIFLINSPRIDHVDIVRKAKVRRAKLYYLRNKVGKKARLVERLRVKIPKHSDLIKAEESNNDENNNIANNENEIINNEANSSDNNQ
mgnify:FL=1